MSPASDRFWSEVSLLPPLRLDRENTQCGDTEIKNHIKCSPASVTTPQLQSPTPAMAYYSYGKPPYPPPADGYKPEFAPLRHAMDPLPPLDPNIDPPTGSDYEKYQRYDWYQRNRLHGFTLQEFKDSGCWYNPDAKPSDLKTAIHSLFEKDRWEKNGTLDIGDGTKGKWEYGNKVVREALVPSLRLASLLLVNSSLWPWYVCPFVVSSE